MLLPPYWLEKKNFNQIFYYSGNLVNPAEDQEILSESRKVLDNQERSGNTYFHAQYCWASNYNIINKFGFVI